MTLSVRFRVSVEIKFSDSLCDSSTFGLEQQEPIVLVQITIYSLRREGLEVLLAPKISIILVRTLNTVQQSCLNTSRCRSDHEAKSIRVVN